MKQQLMIMSSCVVTFNYLRMHGRDYAGEKVRGGNGRDLDYKVPKGTPPIEWIENDTI